jgi:hypothetical protein
MADPDMLWFYKGYLLHMETDACWIRHCMHPFALKYLMSGGKWKDTGTAYYDDMIEVDKYYRSKYAEYQSEAEVMELLQDTQEPAFLPEMLLFSMIERVKELLLATHTSRKDVIRTKYLDEKRVHTFFEKICAVVV